MSPSGSRPKATDPAGPGAPLPHERAWLAAIVLLAAVVRVARWHAVAAIFNDGPVFLAIAERIGDGRLTEAFSHPFHPLYPVLVAGIHALGLRLETAGVAVAVAGGTASVLAMYAFVRGAFGRTEALVSAFVLAVHPAAIEYSGDVQSEALYLACFLAAMAALHRAWVTGRLGPAALGGMLAGVAYLTRPEGLGLALVAAALAAVSLLRGRARLGATLRFGAALGLGLLLVAGPYLVWLRIESGAWTLSGKKEIGVVAGLTESPFQGPDPLAANPQLPHVRDADDPAPGSPQARPPHADEPTRAARALLALGDLVHTHVRTLRYELLALLLLGLALLRARPGPRAGFIAAFVGAYAGLLFLLAWNVGYVSGRHVLPSVSLLFGYVGLTLVHLVRALPAPRGIRLAGVLLLGVAVLGLGKALRPDRLDAVAERRAAEWLRAQPIAVEAVAARKRRTAYYAEAPWVKLASAAFPEGLRRLHATHLVLDDGHAAEYLKLGPLEPPEAWLLHRERANGRSAAVWSLVPPAPRGNPSASRVERSAPADRSAGAAEGVYSPSP